MTLADRWFTLDTMAPFMIAIYQRFAVRSHRFMADDFATTSGVVYW